MKPLNVNEALKDIEALAKIAGDNNTPTGAQQQRMLSEATALIKAIGETNSLQVNSSNATGTAASLHAHHQITSEYLQGDPAYSDYQSKDNEQRYRELFEDAPIAIWVDDWTPIKQMLDAIENVDDWADYFNQRPALLEYAYRSVKTIDISNAAASLYKEESTESLLQHTATLEIYAEELQFFLDQIVLFWNNDFSSIIEARDMNGEDEEIMIRRRTVMPPAHRKDWSRVIYSLEDVSERIKLEGQLRQSQKMEIVGQLTGGIAHDFNNLLAIIQGNAQLLADSTAGINEYIDPILHATNRGAELIQRILVYSKKQQFKPIPINLAALVEDMSSILARSIGETIDIRYNIDPDHWHASADPGQLENALLNLVVNARDAMPKGGQLTISCENLRLEDEWDPNDQEHANVNTLYSNESSLNSKYKAGDYLVLSVTDTGHGMTKEVLDQVFEPFFTTKELGMGTGLGLSMVYAFAKQSGAHIHISSQPDKGTSVKIYLNRTEKPEESIEEYDHNQTLSQAKGERVLVLEDDRRVGSLVQKMLEKLNYQVVGFTGASEALDTLAQTSDFDLVLADVVLPGGTSGPEFLQQAIIKCPELKFVFMTGYSLDSAELADINNVWPILKKPFGIDQLANILDETLNG
ncbi:MAG: response regulator [Gammaproteobacteria bacterium]|nr:response regulator [Gammaproteobacteria bacterium]